MVPLFGAAYAAPNKGTPLVFYTDMRSPRTVLNPHVDGKNQGFFKAFEYFSNTFQGKFNFQGLYKTVLYIQVLFKPVRTLKQIFRQNSLAASSIMVTIFKCIKIQNNFT